MARSRLRFRIVVAVSMVLPAVTLASVAAAEDGRTTSLPVAFGAKFDHGAKTGGFRTLLNGVSPLDIAAGPTGAMSVRLRVEPAGCFAMASWAPVESASPAAGPAVACLTNDTVSEPELNDWVGRGQHGHDDPGLVIPLGPPQPVEPNPSGPPSPEIRLNADRVVGQMWVSGCGSASFRKYANLIVEKGSLAFRFGADARGRPQVDLSAGLVVLEQLDGDTWNRVRQGCDAGQALPVAPVDGLSLSFAGSSATLPLDPSRLSGQIDGMAGRIESLMFEQRLAIPTGQKLLRQLGDVVSHVQRTRVDQAASEIQRFHDSLATLGERGLLDPVAAAELAKTALGIETFLGDRANVPVPPPDPLQSCSAGNGSCPDTVSSCAFTGWIVDAASTASAPDGTAMAPFPSLTGALIEAAKAKICGVTLFVRPGRYVEAVAVTRHTRIVGLTVAGAPSARVAIEGPVSNHGPNVLDLRNVQLSWLRDAPADGVFVDHPCAVTRLTDVDVVGYVGFGIRQRGGSLWLARVGVTDTRALPDSLAHGTGVLLTCGVRGRFVDVQFDFNQTAGLLMAGAGTEVDAIGLVVRRTSVHPSLIDPDLGGPWGAVHVRNEARLVATGFLVADNWMLGIGVYTFAEAVLDHGVITDTADISRFVAGWLGPGGGVGALASAGGHLRMSNFIATRSDLCGVNVIEDGEMDLSGGATLVADGDLSHESEISHAAIGACVMVEGYDVSRITDGVVFRDNGINLQSVSLPLPAPIDIPTP
jgi:hypothetical protein